MKVSEHDRQYATQIIERLLGRDKSLSSLKLEPNIVIRDIEFDIDLFFREIRIFKELGTNIPALKIEEDNVPVSIGSIFRPPWGLNPKHKQWSKYAKNNDFIYDALKSLRYERLAENFHTISESEARGTFAKRSINFLATRISAIRAFHEEKTSEKWGQPVTLKRLQRKDSKDEFVTTSGCNFSVSTNSKDLRVFWSGAYYIAPNYFNYPTSPATGVLQAGTYLFGVDGGIYKNKIEWDTNAVVSLPGSPSVHLNY